MRKNSVNFASGHKTAITIEFSDKILAILLCVKRTVSVSIFSPCMRKKRLFRSSPFDPAISISYGGYKSTIGWRLRHEFDVFVLIFHLTSWP